MPMTDLMIELSFCSVRFHWMLVAFCSTRSPLIPALAHCSLSACCVVDCWLVDYLSFLLFFRSRVRQFPRVGRLVSPLLFSVSGCSVYKYFLRVRPVESTLYTTKYFVHDTMCVHFLQIRLLLTFHVLSFIPILQCPPSC